jgi:hypothetical protein
VAAGGDDRPVGVHGLLGLGRRVGVVGSVDDQDRAVQAVREQQRAEPRVPQLKAVLGHVSQVKPQVRRVEPGENRRIA